MSVEFAITVLTIIFAILGIVGVILLIRCTKSIRLIQKDLHHLSNEGLKLIQTVHDLTLDLKHKSSSLNFLFKALPHEEKRANNAKLTAEIIGWAATSFHIFNQLKGFVKHHEK